MDLEQLRTQINEIDTKMVDLFVQRMQVAAEIASAKAEKHLPVLDKKREKLVLEKIMNQAGEEFALYANTLYQTMFDVSRSYQAGILQKDNDLLTQIKARVQQPLMEFPKRAVVACQGTEGSYAARACGRLFDMPNMMFFESFENVFEAVEKGMCAYGILPLENSTAGSVTEVYDLMVQHQFYIVRSLKLHIHHMLLAKEGTELSQIKEIVSHEQALQQCSAFLKALPNVKITKFANTAMAAKYVAESERTDIAAIASEDCASLYGLSVVHDAIQNHAHNDTRFICIAKNMELYAGANKISLLLSLAHEPGALYQMLGKIAAHHINLSKLESRPIAGRDFAFCFYFDLEASVFSKEVQTLLQDMQSQAKQLSFLGCYAEMV